MKTQRTSQKSPSPDIYHDQGKLHALQVMLCSRIDEVLAELGVSLYRSNRLYTGCCPIHIGDNAGALNLYHKGDTRPGYWKCQTKACQETFGATILGFIRGVLSERQGWRYFPDKNKRNNQPKFPWHKTVEWACTVLGTNLEDVKVDEDELEKVQFAVGMTVIGKTPKQESKGVARAKVRQFLQVPAPYFIARGWSPEILDRYDVGTYPVSGRALSGRVAVPVYDDNHRVAIGFTGRSLFERCEKCKRWHEPGSCPIGEASFRASKWRNEGFKRESVLYNYWFAKKEIEKTGVVLLCEGPGDVWRLEEVGFHNSLAMFGADLSDQQQVILEMSGAMNVVVLTDLDETGELAREKLKKRLGRTFRLHFPQLTRHDLGDMPISDVQACLAPLLNQLKERGY